MLRTRRGVKQRNLVPAHVVDCDVTPNQRGHLRPARARVKRQHDGPRRHRPINGSQDGQRPVSLKRPRSCGARRALAVFLAAVAPLSTGHPSPNSARPHA